MKIVYRLGHVWHVLFLKVGHIISFFATSLFHIQVVVVRRYFRCLNLVLGLSIKVFWTETNLGYWRRCFFNGYNIFASSWYFRHRARVLLLLGRGRCRWIVFSCQMVSRVELRCVSLKTTFSSKRQVVCIHAYVFIRICAWYMTSWFLKPCLRIPLTANIFSKRSLHVCIFNSIYFRFDVFYLRNICSLI